MLKKNLKKYIIFQIWGKEPLFLIGLLENIKLAKIVYPKWKIRIYYSDIPNHFLNRLKNFTHIELIKSEMNTNIKYQIWRILPLFDRNVDIFICRDADSRLNFREKAAVDNWMDSDKPLHIMRDHPTGHKTLILAGMCGFNNVLIRKTIKLKDSQIIHELKMNESDTDQEFLRKIIFPFFSHNHLAHDKYQHFNFGCETDFPPVDPSKKIISNFVGEIHDYYNNPISWKTKNKLLQLDLNNYSTCVLYGFKILIEMECHKINSETFNSHDPFKCYNINYFNKKFINRLKSLENKINILNNNDLKDTLDIEINNIYDHNKKFKISLASELNEIVENNQTINDYISNSKEIITNIQKDIENLNKKNLHSITVLNNKINQIENNFKLDYKKLIKLQNQYEAINLKYDTECNSIFYNYCAIVFGAVISISSIYCYNYIN